MSLKNQAIACVSMLNGIAFMLAFDVAPTLSPDADDRDENDAVFVDAPHMPIAMQARAEQNVGDVVITDRDVEEAFEWVCGSARELVQGSGTVRDCGWVKR